MYKYTHTNAVWSQWMKPIHNTNIQQQQHCVCIVYYLRLNFTHTVESPALIKMIIDSIIIKNYHFRLCGEKPFLEGEKKHRFPSTHWGTVPIIATDVSPSALFLLIRKRYWFLTGFVRLNFGFASEINT